MNHVFLWITAVFLLLYSVFAFLYATVVLYISGPKTSFLFFWPVTCILALVFAGLLILTLRKRLHGWFRPLFILAILFWACILLLGIIGIRVYKAGHKKPVAGADYVIVLGAQVRGKVPSLVLSARIKSAAEYLLANPNAVAIASGGQGSGEEISEAEAIARGLMKYGIDASRILKEDRSVSTLTNLRYSKEIIEQRYEQGNGKNADTADIVIVTNDFHVYRACGVAKKTGFGHVSGLGSTEHFSVTLQYYVRESIGVICEFFRGTI